MVDENSDFVSSTAAARGGSVFSSQFPIPQQQQGRRGRSLSPDDSASSASSRGSNSDPVYPGFSPRMEGVRVLPDIIGVPRTLPHVFSHREIQQSVSSIPTQPPEAGRVLHFSPDLTWVRM